MQRQLPSPQRHVASLPLDAAFADIDIAIEQHHQALLALKMQRNGLTYISRLPSEILVIIFSRLVASSCTAFEPTQWISVAQVCHHWRNVALDTSHLWAWVSTRHPKSVEHFLQRSKSASLHVHIDFVGTTLPKIDALSHTLASVILAEMHRIKELDIAVARWPSTSDTWLRYLQLPAERLERLALTCMSGQIALPSILFDGRCPSLKDLTFHGFHLPWNSSLLRGLSRLSICQYMHIPYGPTLPELIAVLQACPDLFSLAVSGNLRGTDAIEASDVTLSVCLPRLEHLRIELRTPLCTQILRCLHFPPTTALHLCYEHYPISHPVSLFPSNNAVVYFSPPLVVVVDLATLRVTSQRCTMPDSANIEISVSWSQFMVHDVSLIALSTFIEHSWPALADLSLTVNFGRAESVNTISWLRLFVALPHLHRLRIDFMKFGGRSFALAIVMAIDLCPSLVCIELCQVDIATCSDHDLGFMWAALESRYSRACPVRELAIMDCTGVSKSLVEQLSAFVDYVEWDGAGDIGATACASSSPNFYD